MTSMTRGPLPPGVYWRRRLFTVALAASLVLLIGGVLRGGSDGSSGVDPNAVAEQAAGSPSSTGPTSATTPTSRPSAKAKGKGKGKRGASASPATPTTPPLAEPTGPCEAGDVVVTPVVGAAVAGSDVTIGLELRTITAEACTWRISSKKVTVTITSGSDEVWASRKCPRTVPLTDEVIRRAVPTRVDVVWNAHRSNLGCPGRSQWALPGYYHAAAAALGGEPRDVQFRLTAPPRPVITQTPTPSPTAKPSSKPSSKPSQKPSQKPSNKPSQKPGGKPSQKPSPNAGR